MTREELDRLHKIATSGPNGIAKITDHINRLERDARAGRELRDRLSAAAVRNALGIHHPLEKRMELYQLSIANAAQAYDTATESKHG
jgi:hypothetical protein